MVFLIVISATAANGARKPTNQPPPQPAPMSHVPRPLCWLMPTPPTRRRWSDRHGMPPCAGDWVVPVHGSLALAFAAGNRRPLVSRTYAHALHAAIRRCCWCGSLHEPRSKPVTRRGMVRSTTKCRTRTAAMPQVTETKWFQRKPDPSPECAADRHARSGSLPLALQQVPAPQSSVPAAAHSSASTGGSCLPLNCVAHSTASLMPLAADISPELKECCRPDACLPLRREIPVIPEGHKWYIRESPLNWFFHDILGRSNQGALWERQA